MMTTFARGKGRRYSVQRDGIESEVCKCKIAHGKGRLAGSSDALRAMEDILPLRVLLSALILFTRFARGKGWWAMTDSNRRHSRCKRDALTN